MWQDVTHATRSLLRRPLLTGVAVLSLALGIGVNVAVFAAFDRLLLRQLPVPEPERLVTILSPGPRPGSTSISGAGAGDATFSYPLFRDLERLQAAFSGIAAHRDVAVNLMHGADTQRVNAELVSGGYFSTLTLRPALGRLLGDADARPGTDIAAVLSYRYWMRRFGGDSSVLGAQLVINAQQATIVGVAPEGFQGTTVEWNTDVFIPLTIDERFRTADGSNNRQDHWLYVFGRLQPQISSKQAEARLAPSFATLIRDVEFPAVRAELHGTEPRAFLARTIVLEDGSRGGMSMRRDVRLILTLLFVIAGLVLLIACANVANLMMARAVDREGEIAIRLSLGASAGQLLRLLLSEACLLGLVSSGVAIMVARLTVAGAQAFTPANDSGPIEFELPLRLLLFAVTLGIGAGLLVGALPALHALRTRLTSALSSRTARSSRGASRIRTSLAVGQIAVAITLLAQAGLVIASLANLMREDLGIDGRGLLTFGINPSLNGYSATRSLTLFEQLEARLAGLPGVSSASAATIPLLANGFARNTVSVQGFVADVDADVGANYTHVGPGYFNTLGIPLVAGREFTHADDAAAPHVAIVNQSFARKFGLGRDAVGKRMALGRERPPDIEIIGVVADAKYNNIRDRAVAQFFLPYRQVNATSLTFYVRSTAEVRATAAAVLGIVKELDPQLPVENLRTMADQIDRKSAPDRVLTILVSAFAVLATSLAAIGLYGVLAYGLTQRRGEIGLRMALGARAVDVWRLVFAHVGRLGAIGAALGVAASVGLMRVTGALLFGVSDSQAAALAAALGAMALVMVAAAASPARRATRIDPATALRAE